VGTVSFISKSDLQYRISRMPFAINVLSVLNSRDIDVQLTVSVLNSKRDMTSRRCSENTGIVR